MSHQNLNWQLIIDSIYMHSVTQLLIKVLFRLSYIHDPLISDNKVSI